MEIRQSASSNVKSFTAPVLEQPMVLPQTDTLCFKVFERNSQDKSSLFRSSRSKVFCKQSVEILKNFAKFIRKQMCQSLFFNKAAGQSLATFSNKRLRHRWFLIDFLKVFMDSFFTEHHNLYRIKQRQLSHDYREK